MILLSNQQLTTTDTDEIRLHVYDATQEGETDLKLIADDITENGYLDPTGDPTAPRLTNVQVHFLVTLGKLLFFLTFHIPIP